MANLLLAINSLNQTPHSEENDYKKVISYYSCISEYVFDNLKPLSWTGKMEEKWGVQEVGVLPIQDGD